MWILGAQRVRLEGNAFPDLRAGDEEAAEEVYRRLLPTIAFVMQGIAQFVLYGKLIAEWLLGLPEGPLRRPSQLLGDRGRSWARRHAEALGPLAY